MKQLMQLNMYKNQMGVLT